mmetsp:Transcript_34384/g.74262  ORF Transcript_34384/g.74262 Transcript_34384/m.74262 type:complete len:115 (+) Transcript_34384:66-410(+)
MSVSGAFFPPAIREPPPPALELFDLDENFASEANRLAYLTNKCAGDGDIEYYVMEAGHILGLQMPEDTGARAVLGEVFKRIAQWKMVGGMGMGMGTGGDMGAAAGGEGFDRFEL